MNTAKNIVFTGLYRENCCLVCKERGGGGFPIVCVCVCVGKGGKGCTPHPTVFFEKPPMGCTTILKMKLPHRKNKPPH